MRAGADARLRLDLPEQFQHGVLDARQRRLGDVSPVQSRPLVAPGDTHSELLANWIDELQAMSRLERIAPSYFVVDRVEEGGVQGSAAGLPIDQVPEMGKRLSVVASNVEVSRTPDGWWASVPFLTFGPDLRLV